MVLVDSWAFAYSGLLNVTVPSSVTFLGQVVLTFWMIFFSSFLIYEFHYHAVCVCMLVRVLCHPCTGKRVLANLTCSDSGFHLRLLLPADRHHHSDVILEEHTRNFLFVFVLIYNDSYETFIHSSILIHLCFILCRSVRSIEAYAFTYSGLRSVFIPS